ncbi:rod shape-determining protein MreC [Nonomuraea muscovyensis]|uniref:rod shape-determining protein MreC n=1 Tax=Nonomuraea muscovyensis TaxID=1124761 RepID=UPI00340045D2
MRDSRNARLTLGILLTAALVILTVDHRLGAASPFGPLRTAGTWIFGAVERTAGSVTRPFGEFLRAVANAPAAHDDIERLEMENAQLRTALIAQELDSARSQQLKRMLGLAGRGGYKVVTANVIARRGSPGFEEAIQIDAGTADGVLPEMTVLNGDGLIGRVISATADTATAVLISDRGSATGARLEGGQEIGVVHGVGENGRLLQFKLLDATAPLAPGGRIVSFGSQNGRPYVPGVPIGVIERVEATPGELTRVAFARPYADLTALDVVGVVVRAPARDPRDAVLPPKPDPKKQLTETVRPPKRGVVPPERDARDAALRPARGRRSGVAPSVPPSAPPSVPPSEPSAPPVGDSGNRAPGANDANDADGADGVGETSGREDGSGREPVGAGVAPGRDSARAVRPPGAGAQAARPPTRPTARPSARSSARPAARPSAPPAARPSARPAARASARPAARLAERPAARLATWSGAGAPGTAGRTQADDSTARDGDGARSLVRDPGVRPAARGGGAVREDTVRLAAHGGRASREGGGR